MKLVALLLLLSVFSSLTLTEVVKNFSKWNCGEFFMKKPGKGDDRIIPTIFPGHQYKKICQFWENKYRFATVYDTERRIPVYSAYTLSQIPNTKRPKKEYWKIEPQLENIEGNKSMEDSPRQAFEHITHQAVNSDYSSTLNSNHSRGHVFPCSFAADRDQARSTFTLTNIAPQTKDNNEKWAKQVETPMLNETKENCSLDQNHLVYVVTGVVPGNNWIPIERNNAIINNGINIPSHFWSAFFCTSKNNNEKLIGGAYIAEQGEFKLECLSIGQLNKQLTTEYRRRKSLKENESFSVFPGLTVETIKLLCNHKNLTKNAEKQSYSNNAD